MNIQITKNKVLELQFSLDGSRPNFHIEWLVVCLATRSRQDHKGISFTLELLTVFYFCINFYDIRHYN